MKKVFTILLSLFLFITLFSCGDSGQNERDFIGTWMHEKTDAEPFAMSLTLNEDGTGKCSKSTDVAWRFDDAENKIIITLVFSDGCKEDPSFATITADNKLCWERDFIVKTSTEDSVEFDQLIFERE